ncbi:hypothetical protein J3F84DRAFT_398982 [Trichoderma pleuroticola]
MRQRLCLFFLVFFVSPLPGCFSCFFFPLSGPLVMSLGQSRNGGLHEAAEEETKSLSIFCVAAASGSISVGATGLCHRETHHITSLYMALAAALAEYHRQRVIPWLK